MCTLSLFQNDSELIITMNRDESRLRHEAGIKEHAFNGIHTLFPVDGLAGGTWFGINDTGVVMALLNRYQDPQKQGAPTRGQIIPMALVEGNYKQVIQHLNNIDFRDFNPFDLFLFSLENNHHFSWNGQVMTTNKHTENALQFSSSGLNTDVVLATRQARFKQQIPLHKTWQAATILTRLHLHQDPQDTSQSVLMDRPHTHTKSICQVRLNSGQSQFTYYPETSLNQWRTGSASINHLPHQQRELTINSPIKDLV